MVSILIIEDDVAFSAMLKTFFEKRDYKVENAFSAEEGMKKINSARFDIILTDVRLPDRDGLEILKEVKANYPQTQVIVMTNYAEIHMAVKAMKIGAFDYVSKPFQPETILQTISNALGQRKSSSEEILRNNTVSEKRPLKPVLQSEFVKGVSDPARKLNDYIDLVAPTNMSVLIIGESGTGKEHVAKSIHDKSKRKGAPFIEVDSGAIPKEIASSAWFGHSK